MRPHPHCGPAKSVAVPALRIFGLRCKPCGNHLLIALNKVVHAPFQLWIADQVAGTSNFAASAIQKVPPDSRPLPVCWQGTAGASEVRPLHRRVADSSAVARRVFTPPAQRSQAGSLLKNCPRSTDQVVEFPRGPSDPAEEPRMQRSRRATPINLQQREKSKLGPK